VKEIAMEIGKDTVDYVERMYPQAIEATSTTFRLSLRNHIYNQIMGALKHTEEKKIIEWLKFRKNFRRHLKKMNKAKNLEQLKKLDSQNPLKEYGRVNGIPNWMDL
jgi:hypothetical protein